MGVKMGWIQIKMGHPLAQNGAENGAALAPFRANGAHLSICCGFTKSCKKNRQPSDVNFTHARNFPFIFNVKLHACAKIDVDFFARFHKTAVPIFHHRLYRLRNRDWKRNSSSGALRGASQYIFNGQLLGMAAAEMANF